MEITWYGLSCFRMSERGLGTVVTDPYPPQVGLSKLKLKADIVTISHDASGHNYVDAVSNYQYSLSSPGEYEIANVFITGVPTHSTRDKKRNVLFVFDFNNISVAHFGDISKVPSQSRIEELGEVNILLVPIGGGNSLNAVQAAELVSIVEPNIVIPMHYNLPNQKVSLESSERFLKEMGVTDFQEETTLKITTSNLSEETQVIMLQPKV